MWEDYKSKHYEWFLDLFCGPGTNEFLFPDEKREFLLDRTYVFGVLDAKDLEIVKLYYGLYGGRLYSGNCQIEEMVAYKCGCSALYVKSVLAEFAQKLNEPPIKTLLMSNVTDKELGCGGNNYRKFTKDVLEEIATEYLKREKLRKMKKLEELTEEEKLAYKCLEIALNKKLYAYFDVVKGISTNKFTSLENVLKNKMLATKFLETQNSEFIEKIKSIGLSVMKDDESEDDWKMRCCEGILKNGISNFRRFFNVYSLNPEHILYQNIDALSLSVRARNVLERAGIVTIEQLVMNSECELSVLRGMGRKSLYEIQEKLYLNKGLELRPHDKRKDQWLEEVATPFYEVGIEPPKGGDMFLQSEKMDINEIPEKYRKIYAIGAGEVAKREMQGMTVFDKLKTVTLNKKQKTNYHISTTKDDTSCM